MKSSRTFLARPARGIAAGLLAALAFSLSPLVQGDMVVGKLTQDLTVGANHDVALKTGEAVEIMKQSGTTTVIMVPLPDGSNGIFQIDSAAIQIAPAGTPLGLPPPPPKPPPTPGTAAPAYPDDFTGSPTFQTTQGDRTSGAASVVMLKQGGPGYIVSTRQLLGPIGGFEKQTAAKDIPGLVQHIKIANFSGGTKSYDVTGLSVKTARLQAEGGKPIDDMAIYQLSDSAPQTQALVLADQPPVVDDVVWVVARMRGAPDGEFAHRAQVTASNAWLEIQFDNDDLVTGSSSGAPVLNNSGQVVGVFSSHLTESGHIRGYVIPAALIAKTIQSQPAAKPGP